MVAHWVQVPLSVGGQRRCAAGAPGLALWVPHPLRALTILRNSSGARLAHWESDLLADPPVGSIGLLDGQCSCCAQTRCRGTPGRAGGTTGGLGGTWAPLGGLLVFVWGRSYLAKSRVDQGLPSMSGIPAPNSARPSSGPANKHVRLWEPHASDPGSLVERSKMT